MGTKKQILEILKGLGEQVLSTKPDQQESIIAIGTSLEKAFREIHGTSPAHEPLKLSLETLQAIYGGNVGDAPAAIQSVAGIISATEKYYSGDENDAGLFDNMVAELREILDGKADTPISIEQEISLDDITARLVVLGAGDVKQLAEVHTTLKSFSSDESQNPQVLQSIQAAIEQICGIIDGKTKDANSALEAAGQAVANAAEMLEDIQEAAQAADEKSEEEKSEESPTPPVVVQKQEESPAPTATPSADMFDTEAILPEDSDEELLQEYSVECLDHIAAAEASLLELESNPEDAEPINTIFRAFHTIKGSSGFLGLDRIQKLAHLAESLLDRAREGELRIVGGYADISLKSCDTLRTMIEALDGVQPGQPLLIPEHYSDLLTQLTDPEAAGIGEDETPEPMRVGDILVGRGQADRGEVEQVADNQGKTPIGKELIEKNVAKTSDVAKALRTQKQTSRGAKTAEATIRVGTGRLDSLINMVGELVIAQSMITQDPDVAQSDNPKLIRKVSHAGKIIRELQDLTMSLRMVPLKGVFQKMARLVRDLGRKSGKSVSYVTEGEETEIDRNMVEALNDPLVHMIRNAVDHGVESAEDRKNAGKDETGTVCLRAYHAAGNVVIQLQDNGKGLDREKILAKAVERGLIDSEKEISDSEVFNMIFNPGFSTAEKVTDVSGRGVGMDVVRKNIDSLRGRIEITSKKGEGSTFTIRLPMTMAITDSMVIRVGHERYLLPTVSIERSFRPKAGMVSTVVGRGEVVMLRGELLPVFRLHELYNVTDAVTDSNEALLIIVEGEGRRCALMVDELLDQQQVVIKSLGEGLKNIPGISGGAILGDGRVGLILDASGLLELANGDATHEQAIAA